eukprot:gnl/MRDRNA2_/MRDRNA2_34842_c0_seq2.p1 gnl/MRDRNA2_/MRDRNA2_34842_c0~~gnl/MRDRNA2_/MRDRNA2_34842_c0_seq2.p1  ORF type:complete len:272 (+),score=36.62 gnl/MRDRNA2_/MRDRNA2_34842_c0_seq2:70-885(+)
MIAAPFGSAQVLEIPGGVPPLEVLLTSDASEAEGFISARWSHQQRTTLGLDLEWKPVFQKGAPPNGTSLLCICAPSTAASGVQNNVPAPYGVLLWDCIGGTPPPCIRKLLTSKTTSVFGMGLLEDLARLFYEFDCSVTRAVDFLQSWKELIPSGGLTGLTNDLLGMRMPKSKSISTSNWNQRPLTDYQIAYAAGDAYCSCALAEHFISSYGMVEESRHLSQDKVAERAKRLFREGHQPVPATASRGKARKSGKGSSVKQVIKKQKTPNAAK